MNGKLSQEYTARLAGLIGGDTESSHIVADHLLCELLVKLGYVEVVDRFKALKKWYA